MTYVAVDGQGNQTAQAVRHVIAVQAPVPSMGNHDDPAVDGVGPSAVLVHPGTHVDQLVGRRQRKHLSDLTVPVTAQQDVAPCLRGTLLHPVGVASVHTNLGQQNRPGRDRAWSDG